MCELGGRAESKNKSPLGDLGAKGGSITRLRSRPDSIGIGTEH